MPQPRCPDHAIGARGSSPTQCSGSCTQERRCARRRELRRVRGPRLPLPDRGDRDRDRRQGGVRDRRAARWHAVRGLRCDPDGAGLWHRLRVRVRASARDVDLSEATIGRSQLARMPLESGAPGGTRTPDPQVRSLMLYPAELPARRGRSRIGDALMRCAPVRPARARSGAGPCEYR